MIIAGNHETLMNARGAYYALIEAQNLRVKGDDQHDDTVEDSGKRSMALLNFLPSSIGRYWESLRSSRLLF